MESLDVKMREHNELREKEMNLLRKELMQRLTAKEDSSDKIIANLQ